MQSEQVVIAKKPRGRPKKIVVPVVKTIRKRQKRDGIYLVAVKVESVTQIFEFKARDKAKEFFTLLKSMNVECAISKISV